jgi:hypothetical protein
MAALAFSLVAWAPVARAQWWKAPDIVDEDPTPARVFIGTLVAPLVHPIRWYVDPDYRRAFDLAMIQRGYQIREYWNDSHALTVAALTFGELPLVGSGRRGLYGYDWNGEKVEGVDRVAAAFRFVGDGLLASAAVASVARGAPASAPAPAVKGPAGWSEPLALENQPLGAPRPAVRPEVRAGWAARYAQSMIDRDVVMHQLANAYRRTLEFSRAWARHASQRFLDDLAGIMEREHGVRVSFLDEVAFRTRFPTSFAEGNWGRLLEADLELYFHFPGPDEGGAND